MDDEIEILRRRISAIEEVLDQLDQRGGPDCGPTILVKTIVESAYPIQPQSYFACQLASASGDEIEGNPVTNQSVSANTIFVGNVGKAVPPLGTFVPAVQIDGRLVMQYDG